METNARVLRIKSWNKWYPVYWDEGLWSYPDYRVGFKNPKKYIYKYQVRMYRTWKYNRKTKWKRTT